MKAKWIFIQNITQKVDFSVKKWGFIKEKPKKHDFSNTWGCNQADTVTIYFKRGLVSIQKHRNVKILKTGILGVISKMFYDGIIFEF